MKLIVTSYENKIKNTVYKDMELIEDKGAAMNVVNIYPGIEYQTFHGFGGAITEAAGYAYSKLSKANQEKVIDKYFGKDGNRYNMIRTHIDSCDFSLNNYEAMSDPEDVEMKSFTLARDEKYILPLLSAGQEKKGEPFDLMLTPWSPPAFMKTNEDRNHGGKLKAEFMGFWAEYICRYIKEYENKGFSVNRITVQNEPEAVQSWDSCIFTGEEEKVFLRDYLYPALVKNNLSHVKVNIWDHNKERLYERAKATIDAETDKMVDGIAFHWYTGDHFEAIGITRDAYPGKELLFTEGCVEYSRFSASQLQNAQMYAHDIIGNLNAGMTGFLDWNIFLDEKGGPNHVNNFCDAPIMIDTENDTYEEKLSFDYIGHFSRYIEKDAKRIAFTKYTDRLEMTALKNPDGSIVMVALNRTDRELPVSIRIDSRTADITIPGQSIATVLIS
ncbi:glycoside hydrolase family 30 protein [Anaerocolumna sp. MB42-C2]|uniref:glycoside hydrolase family 30 protein n=1 Tax=Anaerocolumna sp. MB42-C2 TaxID=3070997 RepID=UPI0027E151C6|nr:glycoside hydrolase family 30 beta sandwich domain-containing protein [Anaerocolumna sp. MB42-C2]WMJ86382.1 glycoside hydrolase family 30 beta sandwich domain-containing protein [Anaerocolumna sp. MB42-C2]